MSTVVKCATFIAGSVMLVAMGALVRSSGFLVAFLFATAGSLVAVTMHRRIRTAIIPGIAVAVGVLAGLIVEDAFRAALLVALVLIATGAFISDHRSPAARSIALAPGSALFATVAVDGAPVWARMLAFVTVLFVSPATTSFDRRLPYLTYALLAASAIGAYATVPDTEQARCLVGALVPVAVFALWCRRVGEPSGPAICVALVAWVALVGGQGRPGSVIGAIACLGVLALGPLARRANPSCSIVLHVGIVAVASRVAGLRQSAWVAAAVVVPVFVLAAILLVACRSARGEAGAL